MPFVPQMRTAYWRCPLIAPVGDRGGGAAARFCLGLQSRGLGQVERSRGGRDGERDGEAFGGQAGRGDRRRGAADAPSGGAGDGGAPYHQPGRVAQPQHGGRRRRPDDQRHLTDPSTPLPSAARCCAWSRRRATPDHGRCSTRHHRLRGYTTGDL